MSETFSNAMNITSTCSVRHRPKQRFRPRPAARAKKRDQAFTDEYNEESEEKMREVLRRAAAAVLDVAPFEIVMNSQSQT